LREFQKNGSNLAGKNQAGRKTGAVSPEQVFRMIDSQDDELLCAIRAGQII